MFRFLLTLSLILAASACDGDSSVGSAADATTATTQNDATTATGTTDTADTTTPDTVTGPAAAPVRLLGLSDAGIEAIAADGDRVYAGTRYGLFTGVAPDYDLAFVSSFAAAAPSAQVDAIAVLDTGAIFVLTRGLYVLRSDDAGATWVDMSPDLPHHPNRSARLSTDGERLVVAPSFEPALIWEADGAGWRALPNTATEHMFGESNGVAGDLAIDVITFDGDHLVANSQGYPILGAYVLDAPTAPDRTRGSAPAEPTWRLVAGLDKWGYSAFSFDGELGITANDDELFVRDGDGWRAAWHSEDVWNPGVSVLTADGVFLAASRTVLRRSVGGDTWQDVMEARTQRPGALVRGADRLFWIADTLRSSVDLGATWQAHHSDIDVPLRLAVGGDGAIFSLPPTARELYEQRGDAPGAPVRGENWATELIVAGDYVWTNRGYEVHRRPLAGGAFARVDIDPHRGPHEVALRLFAAGGAAFASHSRQWGGGVSVVSCGLQRYDEDASTWVRADAGLPGAYDEHCGAAIATFAATGDTLFVSHPDGQVHRSTDLGASWAAVTGVPTDAAVHAAAHCGDVTLALFDDGALLESHDGGATFTTGERDGLDAVTDLVETDAGCVVAMRRYDGTPTIAISADGLVFQPLFTDFHEPALDLATNGVDLAIATQGRGVFRATLDDARE